MNKQAEISSSIESRLFSTAEAYELLIDKISAILGETWKFVKSNNAFKKKDGDYTTNLFIWRSHDNSSYEYIIFNSDVSVDYKKERIMFYQFRETYHIESEAAFNESLMSFENTLKTDIFPIVNNLNSNNEVVVKEMISTDNFWKYHVNLKYLVDRAEKEALTGLSKDVIDSIDDEDKNKIKEYLNGDVNALNPKNVYIPFCESGLFDELK